jgi:uncharacterized hydrophobic protein (TIGR00271 family)
MAPRGIVAAATASTFTAGLVSKGIGGAAKILPVTFLVIVATVVLYGLTAAPVARRLHVTRPSRTRPLLVGGERWVIDLGRALRSAGLEVLMWAGLDQQREQVRQAGLELAPGELLAAATGRGARLEEITAVLLLTDEDDFNALASVLLTGNVEGRVYRLAPPLRSHGVVAPYTSGEILFGEGLTRGAFSGRYHDGARIVAQPANGVLPAGQRDRAPVWELVEARIRSDAVYAPSFYALLAIAGLIGAVGILTNSQILIVGAMVVGPEYNAIMGVALGIDKRARRPVLRGLLALLAGFSAAVVVTLLFGLAIRGSGHTPRLYQLGIRPVSDLINNPNLFSVVVAVLAGIVGVVSLTEARASALISVFISVTTIPAAADVGLSLAIPPPGPPTGRAEEAAASLSGGEADAPLARQGQVKGWCR